MKQRPRDWRKSGRIHGNVLKLLAPYWLIIAVWKVSLFYLTGCSAHLQRVEFHLRGKWLWWAIKKCAVVTGAWVTGLILVMGILVFKSSCFSCHNLQGFHGTGSWCGNDVPPLHFPWDCEHRLHGSLQICIPWRYCWLCKNHGCDSWGSFFLEGRVRIWSREHWIRRPVKFILGILSLSQYVAHFWPIRLFSCPSSI